MHDIIGDIIDWDEAHKAYLAGAGQTAETDDDGRFTALGLLVGSKCRLFAYNPDGGNSDDALGAAPG